MKITKKKMIIMLSDFAATLIMLIAVVSAISAVGGLFLGAFVWSAGLGVLAVVFGLAGVKIIIAVDDYVYPVK